MISNILLDNVVLECLIRELSVNSDYSEPNNTQTVKTSTFKHIYLIYTIVSQCLEEMLLDHFP